MDEGEVTSPLKLKHSDKHEPSKGSDPGRRKNLFGDEKNDGKGQILLPKTTHGMVGVGGGSSGSAGGARESR